jgi:hypothetical protein
MQHREGVCVWWLVVTVVAPGANLLDHVQEIGMVRVAGAEEVELDLACFLFADTVGNLPA